MFRYEVKKCYIVAVSLQGKKFSKVFSTRCMAEEFFEEVQKDLTLKYLEQLYFVAKPHYKNWKFEVIRHNVVVELLVQDFISSTLAMSEYKNFLKSIELENEKFVDEILFAKSANKEENA